MGRRFIDCREMPSDLKCSVAISADTDAELLEAAVQHAIAVHGHKDTVELRAQIKGAFRDGTPPSPDAGPRSLSGLPGGWVFGTCCNSADQPDRISMLEGPRSCQRSPASARPPGVLRRDGERVEASRVCFPQLDRSVGQEILNIAQRQRVPHVHYYDQLMCPYLPYRIPRGKGGNRSI
jgi:predicted small metal-binding protein